MSETPEELFAMYPRLASRVTNLRTVIQNPDFLTRADAKLWLADYKSVMEDMMALADKTVFVMKEILDKKEKEDGPPTLP